MARARRGRRSRSPPFGDRTSSAAEPRRSRSRPSRPSAPRPLARRSVCSAEPAQALDAVGHHHRHPRDQSGPDRGGDRHGGRALLQTAAGRRRPGPLAPLRIRHAEARRAHSARHLVRQPRGNPERRDNRRGDRGADIDLVWPGAGRCRASSRPRHGDHRQLLRRARRARDRRTNVPLRGRLGAGRRSGDGAERGTCARIFRCTRRRRRTRRPGEQRALHRHRRHASRLSRDERFPTVGILDSGDELPTREQRRAISLGCTAPTKGPSTTTSSGWPPVRVSPRPPPS